MDEQRLLYIHIPGYYNLITDRSIGNLTSGIRAEKNGGHVPYGGIANGLSFIYKP